ncbi:uncharacterized protein LOC129614321 [Condylostylus longicornis]|uniref:uncharacterized protein LOC129614321 n=1 Tax=Condylostylus longicornis TaxID=2530218 RepID=UPI00244DE87C|nr:uncharacterized protein LOC129614321 [Condylostylus longicornis]
MTEHNFIGTWEIIKCTFEGNVETSGLENIKFRLDETGDITWYNDLSSLPQPKDCYNCCDSASVLFSCETFDVNEQNPRLIFGAFAGHSIEFNTSSLTPIDLLILECENWYTLHCKRLKDDQAGQEKEFTFVNSLKDNYFCDVTIKSCDGVEYQAHSVILRLNGFDCSMCSSPNSTKNCTESNNIDNSNKIKISVTSHSDLVTVNKNLPKFDLSPTYLQLPTNEKFLANKNNLSSSFNSLDISYNQKSENTLMHHANSSSDSNLQINSNHRTIFNFSNEVCSSRKPPLSPYKARSPSPFLVTTETPPSSPLTPVGILNDLPSFLLSPIINWLYTESLTNDLLEENCEKIINFAETQPPLIKIVEPCKKYLKLTRLKKFVVDTVMDINSILSKIINKINSCSTSYQTSSILRIFKDCLKEAAIGFGRILIFCNIFVTDGADISRNQRNEIIKYIRSKISVFIPQLHKLLDTILKLLLNLSIEEKSNLINSLIPEIEYSFEVLTKVVEEIKKSLEKICKDMKCYNIGIPAGTKPNLNKKQNILRQNSNLVLKINNSSEGFTSQNLNIQADNDLKLLLYMYEVRKLHDIYGRISVVLDILKEKRSTFCEMGILDKISTINQNFEQLLVDIPAYIVILENLSDKFDDNIGWKEFKFCFKLATSQINGVLTKLLDHKPALIDAINQICDLVKHDEFTKCLIDLGLLAENNILENKLQQFSEKRDYDYKYAKLNLVKGLCEPPTAANSSLAKAAIRLLHSNQITDMEFEIIQNYKDPSSGQNKCQTTIFRAHRIIIASRCEWFKKALMSGMVESITNKIVITDTSPVIFRRLLLYLYGAPVDETVGAEQICELMLLADRYSIDDLKALCENALNSLIDENSVVCLLGIADRYLASGLRSKCLSFLSQNPRLTKQEIFKELPKQVQQEVRDLILWYGRVPEPWNERSRGNLKGSLKGLSRSRKSSPSLSHDVNK